MKRRSVFTFLLALTCLVFTSCEKTQDTSIPVKFKSLTTDNGSTGGTGKLTLMFDRTIDGLTIDNIELNGGSTGVQKGALTMLSTGTYELKLNNVKASGEISIKVSRNGYSFTPSQKSIVINSEAGVITNKPFITAVEKVAKVTFTKNADGNVVVADNQALINSIKELDVNKRRLKNIEGIEYFTNLKQLNCRNNILTTLDLSKNTMLEQLDCSVNQLSTLDLSKNTMLEQLGCGINKLTELDVSKNTMLESLSCAGNQLTKLDVSKNTMLESLGCDNNQLTKLDITKLSKFEPTDKFQLAQSSTIELSVTAAQKKRIDVDQTGWVAKNKVNPVAIQ